jgi:hypothetical protein
MLRIATEGTRQFPASNNVDFKLPIFHYLVKLREQFSEQKLQPVDTPGSIEISDVANDLNGLTSAPALLWIPN